MVYRLCKGERKLVAFYNEATNTIHSCNDKQVKFKSRVVEHGSAKAKRSFFFTSKEDVGYVTYASAMLRNVADLDTSSAIPLSTFESITGLKVLSVFA